MTTSHRRLNTIDTLMINGGQSNDPMPIRGSIVDFYQDLLKKTKNWRPAFNMHDVQSISTEEKGVFEEEVLTGIKMCVADKAPGSDRYTMVFIQVSRKTIKGELM